MRIMYYRVYETDEAIDDLSRIAISIYDYTRDKNSGEKFIDTYSDAIETLYVFPTGFRGICIEYRGYEIHIYPFGDYSIFFTVEPSNGSVIVLRVLHQKQNWQKIMALSGPYHIQGKII